MTARSAALRAALLLAPACAAAVAVCVPGTALAPARAQADGDDVGGRVLAELNREPDARGLAPLVRPTALQSAAEQRARDIATMPESRRMNRSPRIDAFLAANGITRYAYARERLLMLGGYDEPVARILDLWKGYDEGWRAAMDPDVSEAGLGWAHAADGWSIFFATVDTVTKTMRD